MKIHEQNKVLKDRLITIADDIVSLEMALERKTGSPYPDGSRDNLVNIATDVLPVLDSIRHEVGLVLQDVS